MSAAKLDESWKAALEPEFSSPYMAALREFLVREKALGKEIFPKGSEYFRALDLTPLGDVRVVILGQDPYHGDGQAHGLCFSVRPGVRIPPSLDQYLQGAGARPWHSAGAARLSRALGEAGRAAAQQRAHRRARHGGVASGTGLGAVHGCGDTGGQRAGCAGRLHALGRLCAAQGRLCRCVKASGPESAAPLAAVGASGLYRLRAFFQGECVFGEKGLGEIDWRLGE